MSQSLQRMTQASSATNTNGKNSQNVRSGEDSNNNTDEKCSTCGETECVLQGRQNKLIKVTSKWITCDTCNLWYHGLCQELQPAEVTSITKLASKGVRWHCTECIEKFNNINGDKNAQIINAKTAKQIDNIESMVKSFTLNSNHLQEIERKWSDVLKQNTENINKNIHVAQQAKTLMEKSHQLQEEESRKNNAIVTGILEDENKTAIEHIQELMKLECFTKSNLPIQAIRLGRKTENTEKKRPIKVRFEDEQTKWEFVKRFNNHTLRSRNIYCKLDESQVVRNQQFQLRQEVNKLKSENVGKEYRVRNLQIQEKKESGEWKVMK